MRDNTARSVAQCLFKDVLTCFDYPVELVSDRGGHYVNWIIKHMTRFFLVLHKKSSQYYPQSNVLAESTNKQIMQILTKFGSNHLRDWDVVLPTALWAYRIAFKVATTHFKLAFQMEAITPIEYVVPSLWLATEERLLPKDSLVY